MAKAKCKGGSATWECGTEVPHSKDLSPSLAGDTHLNVATFRQNVGMLSVAPALWRGAATSHSSPREA